MPVTQFTTDNIGEVRRNDLDITTTGEAVIRKIIAGTNVTISSTGVDAGTGDVTINASLSAGSGITRTINTISTTTTVANVGSTDYIYFCTGTFTVTINVNTTNMYTIKNIGTGLITVVASSGLVEGSSSVTINASSSIDIVSDLTNLYII